MWSKNIFLLFVMCLMSTLSDGQRDKTFFRKDYKYIESTESFYKFHSIPKTWKEAKQTCALEGAQLFYPKDDNEAEAVSGIWRESQPIEDIFIGISDLVAKGVYETIDGIPIDEVYSRWDVDEPNNADNHEDCVVFTKIGRLHDYPCYSKFPYICKKTLMAMQWNYECNMPYLEYKINSHLGRCYKFHLKPLSWPEAHAVCTAEQSYLAVINSQVEADHLVDLTVRAPKYTIQEDFMTGVVHLGYHNRYDEGWTTVRGAALEDAGYLKWAGGQPDGGKRGVSEQCGSMYYSGQLNDVECDKKAYFICEHEVDADNHSRNVGTIQ